MQLSAMRKQYSKQLQDIVEVELQEILSGIPLKLDYRQGWSEELCLADAMELNRERDIRSGFTNAGIHRDDLRFMSEGRIASEILSRGQSKRLCLALLLATLKLVSKSSQSRIILLIDDLHSELDSTAQSIVYQQFIDMDLQMFISNIDSAVPQAINKKEFKLFHVEHGIIKPRNFS
jgi:DNA replication and repair protein RecF